jgi:hypothetical protein
MQAPRIFKQKRSRILLWAAGIASLFVVYASGISHNPPGFYVDESALAYSAHLVSRTGAGEFGPRFPLYFEVFTNVFTQYVSPTQVYLLAFVFRFLPPSILVARIFSALWVFAGCLLLGLLAKRISGQLKVGLIVAATALLTPWFFETRGLLMEPHFVPLALVLLLLAVYHAQATETWNWRSIAAVATTLALLTYCYTGGRVLGALLAVGLVFFATTKQRLIGVVKTWLLYGATILPIFVFNREHPAALIRRLYEISYIKPGVPWSQIASEFVRRYLEDQSLTALLLTGDYHQRHHVQGSGGAIFFATFILAMVGLLLVITHRWRDPWWRFVVFGLAVSIVPGAITIEPFHQLRLMGYAVFLLLLTVPALEWLLAPNEQKQNANGRSPKVYGSQRPRVAVAGSSVLRSTRLGILGLVLALTILQAIHFQTVFRRDGPKREFEFDVPYKAAYDAAVAQPVRPIYLEDGKLGPAYMHALWYATVEDRPKSEFVHLAPGARPPAGAVVISSADNCQNCEIIKRSGMYFLYRSK